MRGTVRPHIYYVARAGTVSLCFKRAIAAPGVDEMRYSAVLPAAVVFALLPSGAQTLPENEKNSPLYKYPVRVLGQIPDTQYPWLSKGYAPNMVEGHEFHTPQGVALDTSVDPPILYVADTANHRVLAWRNAQTANGATQADLVLGQPDFLSTAADNPTMRTGLDSPSAIAVDKSGNVYVLDAGNNRILRFPKPFEDTNSPKMPDAVIGQLDFKSKGVNINGTPSEASLFLHSTGSGTLPGALAFDGSGNLYVSDTGNNRVLRYDKSALDKAATQQVTASVILGQTAANQNSYAWRLDQLEKFYTPWALAIDSQGNLFVADRYHRILVFKPPFETGESALRLIGVPSDTLIPAPGKTSFAYPQGLAMAGDSLLVCDTANNRILKFPPLAGWPAAPSLPEAVAVFGQPDFTHNKAGTSATALWTPMHAVATAAEIYVADASNNRLVVFPAGGAAASRISGQLGPDYGGVNLAQAATVFTAAYVAGTSGATLMGGGVAVDRHVNPPRLYVADTFNNRVLAFCDARSSGTPAFALGQPDLLQTRANYTEDGSGTPSDSNLNMPVGLAIDAAGRLYVADFGNGRVLRFPDPCAHPGEPHRADLVLGQNDFTTRQTTTSAKFMGQPYGLTFTPAGSLLVSDVAYNRVLLFKKAAGGDFTSGQDASTVFGQPDFASTAPGTDNSHMSSPRFLGADSSGQLYVADYLNRRILVFTEVETTASGPHAALIITRGWGTEALWYPHGLAIDNETGELWATTLNDSRSPLYRFPDYATMALSGAPSANLRLSMVTPGMGIALDGRGALVVVEQGNRISRYVPPAEATDGAQFVRYRELAPGMIATVWPGGDPLYKGRPFADVPTDGYDWHDPALLPLPATLNGIQVLVDGKPAPLYYVSETQINFQVPQSARTTGVVEILVVREATGEIVAAGLAPMTHAQPAFLLHSAAPFKTGQVAAMNASQGRPAVCNGDASPVTPAIAPWCPGGVAPVRRGEYISLYLTGAGVFPNMPADGEMAPSQELSTDNTPTVVIGSAYAEVQYSGAAPGMVGVWEIRAKVPENAPPGPVPVGILFRGRTAVVPAGYASAFITVK